MAQVPEGTRAIPKTPSIRLLICGPKVRFLRGSPASRENPGWLRQLTQTPVGFASSREQDDRRRLSAVACRRRRARRRIGGTCDTFRSELDGWPLVGARATCLTRPSISSKASAIPSATTLAGRQISARRLAAHNGGLSAHTASGCPWRVIVSIEFADAKKAAAFERYLKSGSGRAFAQRHFR